MADKLEQIENGLEVLREASRRNTDLTNSLVEILNSFESRIGRLQETILPVYHETETLRLKQQNLEKTLKLTEEVIGYYNVSRDFGVLIKNGPNSVQLEDFIGALNQIENAAKHFEKNNSQSVELENLLDLFNNGSDALSKEFSEILKRHSKVLPAVAILEMIEEDHSTQQNSSVSMPEHVQNELKVIAEWLHLRNIDTYMSTYATTRSNILLRSIQGLKDYQKSSSLTMASPQSISSVPSPGSPLIKSKFRHGDSKKARFQYVLEKKASKMLQKATEYSGISSRKSEMRDETSVSDRESEHFLILATAMLKLMQIESQLMLGVIPMQNRLKIFEIISKEAFELLFNDGENISGRIKKSIGKHDYSAILTIFPIIKTLQTLQPGFDEIFIGSFSNPKSNKLSLLLKTFQTNGMRALEEFIDNIRNEQTSQLPKDGTVHEVTSNVLIFLEHLTEYSDVVASTLAHDSNYSGLSPSNTSKNMDSAIKNALLGSYIRRVLTQLNLTLVTCSDLYYDHSIRAIFRLNNACYILKCLQSSILLDLLKTKEPECQQNYIDMMEDQKKAYLHTTWKKVEDKLFGPDDIPIAILKAGKLRDKDKQVIKDKFSAFNRELDEICRLQQTYAVPDPELRATLRYESRNNIYTKYKEFYDKYAHVPFTKSPEKYIKSTPESISALIDSFFDSS